MSKPVTHHPSPIVRDKDKLPVIFLMGPTASGKTDLALALAERLPADIVSVDSTLVYRGLDIGTAKPSAEERAQVPHWLIDIRDPADPYSAADFRADALVAIESIHRAGRIPLLVGGTMLYYKVLLEGLAAMPGADPAVRQRLMAEAAEQGWPAMHQRLAAVDPALAAQLHPNHSQRICRALEVYELTGQTMTALRQQQNPSDGLAARFAVTQLVLSPQRRQLLHQRIAQRFQRMLALGFEQEVRQLQQRGDLTEDLPALRAVGYRQMWQYLEGLIDYDTMVTQGIAATRQLAKRQLTWLRRWPNCHWLYTDTEAGMARKIEEIRDQALNYSQSTPI